MTNRSPVAQERSTVVERQSGGLANSGYLLIEEVVKSLCVDGCFSA